MTRSPAGLASLWLALALCGAWGVPVAEAARSALGPGREMAAEVKDAGRLTRPRTKGQVRAQTRRTWRRCGDRLWGVWIVNGRRPLMAAAF